MKLEDAIRQAIDHVRIGRPSYITRASEGPHAYQIRFVADASPELKTREPRGIRVEGRRWIDQSGTIAQTSARGTVGPFVGWARWSTFMGFGVASILADDWTIAE